MGAGRCNLGGSASSSATIAVVASVGNYIRHQLWRQPAQAGPRYRVGSVAWYSVGLRGLPRLWHWLGGRILTVNSVIKDSISIGGDVRRRW